MRRVRARFNREAWQTVATARAVAALPAVVLLTRRMEALALSGDVKGALALYTGDDYAAARIALYDALRDRQMVPSPSRGGNRYELTAYGEEVKARSTGSLTFAAAGVELHRTPLTDRLFRIFDDSGHPRGFADMNRLNFVRAGQARCLLLQNEHVRALPGIDLRPEQRDAFISEGLAFFHHRSAQ